MKKFVPLILQTSNIKQFYFCVSKNIPYDSDGAIKCSTPAV